MNARAAERAPIDIGRQLAEADSYLHEFSGSIEFVLDNPYVGKLPLTVGFTGNENKERERTLIQQLPNWTELQTLCDQTHTYLELDITHTKGGAEHYAAVTSHGEVALARRIKNIAVRAFSALNPQEKTLRH